MLLLAPFQYLMFDGKLMQVLESDLELTPHVQPAHIKAPLLPVADLLARACAASPGFAPDSLSFHDAGDANARVEIYGQQPQRRLNTLAGDAMDAATGKVLRVLAPQTMAPGVASLRGLQALHCPTSVGRRCAGCTSCSAWAARSCSTAAICCG